MDHAQLIQGFSDQSKVADAHFLVSVVELTPFLSISVCWFRLLQTGCPKLNEALTKFCYRHIVLT